MRGELLEMCRTILKTNFRKGEKFFAVDFCRTYEGERGLHFLDRRYGLLIEGKRLPTEGYPKRYRAGAGQG